MRSALVLLLLLAAVVLAGCQQTPEQPVVVQKDMEQMIEKGMTQSEAPGTASPEAALDYAALCAHYGVPERFEKSIHEGSLTINSDVPIELPEALSLPMVRVEAAKFSQDRVYALWDALCDGRHMVLMPSVLDKKYFEQKIISVQADIATQTDPDTIDALNDFIEILRKDYEAAPDSIDFVSSDGTLQTMDVEFDNTDAASGSKTCLDATDDPYNMDYSAVIFSVNNDTDYTNTSTYAFEDEDGNLQVVAPKSGSRLSFQREGIKLNFGQQGAGYVFADVTEQSLTGEEAVQDCLLTTSPRQAREIVEKLMADAGLTDMVIDTAALYSSRINPESGIPVDPRAPANNEPETQAYVFRLLRQINGVKVESLDDYSETSIDEMTYGKEWWYESLTVAVDDKGIANLFWTGPLNTIEILTEDTEILPWSDIENVFDVMMPVQFANLSQLDAGGIRIDVTRVSLSLQRIMERDSFTTGLAVPVWNFYGAVTYTKKVPEQGEEITSVQDMGDRPLLSVNAIDGSVIDIDKGY